MLYRPAGCHAPSPTSHCFNTLFLTTPSIETITPSIPHEPHPMAILRHHFDVTPRPCSIPQPADCSHATHHGIAPNSTTHHGITPLPTHTTALLHCPHTPRHYSTAHTHHGITSMPPRTTQCPHTPLNARTHHGITPMPAHPRHYSNVPPHPRHYSPVPIHHDDATALIQCPHTLPWHYSNAPNARTHTTALLPCPNIPRHQCLHTQHHYSNAPTHHSITPMPTHTTAPMQHHYSNAPTHHCITPLPHTVRGEGYREKNSNRHLGENENRKMPQIAEIANFWLKGKIAK